MERAERPSLRDLGSMARWIDLQVSKSVHSKDAAIFDSRRSQSELAKIILASEPSRAIGHPWLRVMRSIIPTSSSSEKDLATARAFAQRSLISNPLQQGALVLLSDIAARLGRPRSIGGSPTSRCRSFLQKCDLSNEIDGISSRPIELFRSNIDSRCVDAELGPNSLSDQGVPHECGNRRAKLLGVERFPGQRAQLASMDFPASQRISGCRIRTTIAFRARKKAACALRLRSRTNSAIADQAGSNDRRISGLDSPSPAIENAESETSIRWRLHRRAVQYSFRVERYPASKGQRWICRRRECGRPKGDSYPVRRGAISAAFHPSTRVIAVGSLPIEDGGEGR